VASRLGEAGERLHARARGEDPRPLVPRTPPPDFREGMALEWPLVALEPFLFVARTALERLAARLERQGLACARLELSLALEPDGHHERALTLPAPTREVKTLLTLLRLELEKEPPGAPVSGFSLAAVPDRPRAAQLTLFGPPEIPPDRLATTLARLFALLGSDRVGAPATSDGHRPERCRLVPFAPPPPPRVRPPATAARGLLGVRVLRPPVPLEVLVDEAATPPAPRSLRPLAGSEERRPVIEGRVRVASGPWQLEEGWWQEEPVEREYWDVETEGGVFRLYREAGGGAWFADGVYD
jgi:protein ImuB